MKTQPHVTEYLSNALAKPRDPSKLLGVTLASIPQGFYYAYQDDTHVIFFTKYFCAN
jgi:hypothetical protein